MKNKAFTLIELLVVVLIIGILAAIAVPQYQKAVYKTKFANVKTIATALANAEEEYFLVNGKYANNYKDLSINFSEPQTKDSICDKDGCNYYFDWGYCSLNGTADPARIVCRNDSTGIHYRINLFNSPSEAGIRACYPVNDTYTLALQICQAETGKTEPDAFRKNVQSNPMFYYN